MGGIVASQSVAFPESATAAIAIPVQKAEGSTSHDLENRREEIDVGRPLSLRIVSMYAGDAEHDAALVTSAVRNPSLGDAAPRAMHYVFEDIGGKGLLRPQPDQPGSDVFFYSPAVLDDMLSINLRFSFDNFDADKYRHWLDVAS